MMIIILIINTMFMLMNHPMSMGLVLLTQTLLISMWSGMILKTFWMSYILTITMLSGMLVLFIYMSSVASNEKFKTSMKMWMYMMLSTLMGGMFLFLLDKMIIKNNYAGMEMKMFKSDELFLLNKIFNMENHMMVMIMVMYLLYTMIVSTYLVNIYEGPMRMKI